MGNQKNCYKMKGLERYTGFQLALLGLIYSLSCHLFAADLTLGVEQNIAQPLKHFMPVPSSTVDLKTTSSQHDFYIPVSNRLNISKAELRLSFTNSISLLSERSHLVVKLNDGVVAQLPLLRPETHKGVDVSFILPHDLLKSGFNRLSIGVVQHYTLDCEDPTAPELWTQINTEKSMIALQGTMKSLQPVLSDINGLVAPAIGNPLQYHVLFPETSTGKHLSAAALAVQGIGLQLEYRNATFYHGTAKTGFAGSSSQALSGLDTSEIKGSDIILIGTADELQPFLSQSVVGAINDAYLGIFPLPGSPNNFALVVSGQTEDQLNKAARALSQMNFPFPDESASLISHLEIPAQSNYGRRAIVKVNEKYKFSRLNFQTQTIEGMGKHSIDQAFYLPADFFAQENKRVKIQLDFSYGAKLRSDSVLNIYLNGHFEQVIALSNKKGAVMQDYEISIPFRSFRPGKNTLRFEPAMIPRVGGKCIAVNDRNLRFTLFDTSTIEFPFASHFTAQPNLKLFSETIFPYQNDKNNESKIAFSILSNDDKTIAATWMLLAKFAQINDALLNAEFFTNLPVDNRQLIVVSPFDKIDPKLYETAPFTLDGSGKFRYPSGFMPKEEKSEGLFARLTALFGDENHEPNMEPVEIVHSALPVKHGVVTAFQSPFASKHTVTLFAAETPGKLHHYIEQLVKPRMWTQMKGDVALWTTDEDKPLKTQQVGEQYFVGTASVTDKMGFHLSSHPWLLVLGVLILILLLAWLTHILLNRRFLRRHGRDVRVDP